MDLIPKFELGVMNAWIFILYLLFFTALYFFTSLRKRRYPEGFQLTNQEKVYEIFENIFRLLVFLYPVFLPLQIGTVWFYVGISITFIGMIFYALVFYFMITTAIDKPITKGIFRFSRHPGHLTPYLIFLGISLMCISWLYLVIASGFIFFHCEIAIVEERADLEKYGEEYKKYMQQTSRWIGFPNKK